MSVRITPCFRCPLAQGCEEREAWRKKVSGLGLRSVRFNCPKLVDALRPGRRIVVTRPVKVVNRYGEHTIDHEPVKATILASRKDAYFCCVVDPEEGYPADWEKYRFRKMRPAYRVVRFLDEPDAVLCNQGCVVWPNGCDTQHGECYCNNDFDMVRGLNAWAPLECQP